MLFRTVLRLEYYYLNRQRICSRKAAKRFQFSILHNLFPRISTNTEKATEMNKVYGGEIRLIYAQAICHAVSFERT